MPNTTVEPWLRDTHTELDAVRRQVVHALELTVEDVHRWAGPLGEQELNACPLGLPSVAFQLRHIARSLDRLLTYAEGEALTEAQRADLSSEADYVLREEVLREFAEGLKRAKERVLLITPEQYEEVRHVGRDRLATTAGALLIHCAEHTQRHAGQMVTTAKVVMALREPARRPGEVIRLR